jgi:hypothetical protein
MTIDRQVVAEHVRQLRATLPAAGDLLVGLQRVTEATRAVVRADGAGLTLVHEDGRPRWVAVSDAAMELLEEVQHDLGEGPCVAAYAEDRVVAVEDLAAAPAWDRVAAVVAPLQVRGVLSVPVRLAGQPVGTLDVCAVQPRAWPGEAVEAAGAFATLSAELIRTGVELAAPGAGGRPAAAGVGQPGLGRAGQGRPGGDRGGDPGGGVRAAPGAGEVVAAPAGRPGP